MFFILTVAHDKPFFVQIIGPKKAFFKKILLVFFTTTPC